MAETQSQTKDVNEIALEILRRNEGKLIPTFNRNTGTAFWKATGTSLSKVLFALANDGIIVKDLIRFKPKKFKVDGTSGNYVMFVDGLEVIRKPGKDGKVAEAIFYLKDAVPEWVQRRHENDKKINSMVDEIRQFSEGIQTKITEGFHEEEVNKAELMEETIL